MQQYKVSTYINSLKNNGFNLVKMIEDAQVSEELKARDENRWYNWAKVQSVPTTIFLKCENL